MSICSASQANHSFDNELALRISDHGFLGKWALYIRPLACARQTTAANILETGLSNEPRIKGKEQGCQPLLHCWRVQFYRDKSSQGHPLTMSGSTWTFQKVLRALILSCGLASINQPVLVSVISEMAIARRQINRSKKVCKGESPRNHLSSTSAHHQRYPALHRTWKKMRTGNMHTLLKFHFIWKRHSNFVKIKCPCNFLYASPAFISNISVSALIVAIYP